MIFATDLDRTMIYSKIFLEDFKEPYRQVEIYKGAPISYITEEAVRLLKCLSKKAPIIPITTRNFEQYHRIHLFEGELTPEIYVINNGGSIYYKGKLDEKWESYMKLQLKSLKWNFKKVIEFFLENYKGPIDQYKKSDDFLWLVLGDRNNIHTASLKEIKEKIEPYDWQLDVNGRKIYLYPKVLTKWSALSYIQKQYYNEEICACGDSLFDQEMVTKADYGMIPKDAYIAHQVESHVLCTRQEGIRAAEDLLSYALYLSEKNMFHTDMG